LLKEKEGGGESIFPWRLGIHNGEKGRKGRITLGYLGIISWIGKRGGKRRKGKVWEGKKEGKKKGILSLTLADLQR